MSTCRNDRGRKKFQNTDQLQGLVAGGTNSKIKILRTGLQTSCKEFLTIQKENANLNISIKDEDIYPRKKVAHGRGRRHQQQFLELVYRLVVRKLLDFNILNEN